MGWKNTLIMAVSAALLPGLARAADQCTVNRWAHLPVTMEGPRASVAAKVNGKDTRFWLDSGGFFNFMSKAKAAELGLRTESLPAYYRVNGVGGDYSPQLATVRDLGLFGVNFRNIEFVVGGSDAGNAFIAADLLGKFDTEYDLAHGAVNFFKVSGCKDANLAYWSQGMAVGVARLIKPENSVYQIREDNHIYFEVFVNGHKLVAMLDTGSPISWIARSKAEHSDIDMNASGVVASHAMAGLGPGTQRSWIARAKLISIGGEEIRNSPIRIIDDEGERQSRYDMLLGMDFLLSHRVFVSQELRRVFLTYSGGAIFSSSTDHEVGAIATRTENMGAAAKETEPKTADEFAGRGSARLERHELDGAIADLSEAIRLAPARTDLLTARARAYLRQHKADLAAKDIDAALVIAPGDYRLLLRRAGFRLAHKDRAGALADADAAAAAAPKGSLDILSVVTLYELLGKADRGLALIDAVIALHRNDVLYAELVNARGWNRALANADLDRALGDANSAVRKSGGNPSVLDTRALIHVRRSEWDAAIADETAALAKEPKSAGFLFVRGLARLGKHDDTAAATDFAEARKLNPKIDALYAEYGLIAPRPAGAPAVTDAAADEDEDQ